MSARRKANLRLAVIIGLFLMVVWTYSKWRGHG